MDDTNQSPGELRDLQAILQPMPAIQSYPSIKLTILQSCHKTPGKLLACLVPDFHLQIKF